jgi:prepilin-type N-terminal cleavage/methylation domain-containing protein
LLNLSQVPFPVRPAAKRCAFSLVELLVVVAIISIMAGLLTLITKNTKAALFIANDTANGHIPFRHWSVGYLDKSSGNWTLSKKWEPLPEGTVFLQTLTNASYNVLTKNDCPQQVGQPQIPTGFANTTNIVIAGTTFTELPYILFGSDGAAMSGNATPLTNAAIRIASGLANTNREVTLTSTNQYFFVETDGMVGRIRMRAPEDYK